MIYSLLESDISLLAFNNIEGALGLKLAIDKDIDAPTT
jgi:hypothetical protein